MNRGVDFEHEQPRIGNRQIPVAWKIAALLVVGTLIGALSMATAASIYKRSLLTRISSIAEALDSTHISALRSKPGSKLPEEDYRYVRSKLANIKASNKDIRFVYAMARDSGGNVYFLADSEPTNSRDYSPNGEQYPEASAELRAAFDNNRPFVEGPSRDSYGSWLSALAPVVDDQTYRVTAVLGMDVPATTYAILLAATGGLPLIIAVLAATIVYIRYQNQRRHQANIQFRAEMISIASHELRTPLTGLRWSQESLMSNKLPEANRQRTMEIMYDSTLRLQESIEDILQLASMESGRAKLYLKPTDLKDTLQTIMKMQQLAAERKAVSLVLGEGWPDKLVLEVDGQRLKRVFHNLVSNAIKYSNQDTEVVIGYQRADDGGHIISIKDHGIGIPESEQAHVWDGFYRASNTTAHDITGTGMGLYLAREIISQHGGRTWLESKEGEGTTIFVELPDTVAEAAANPGMQTRG